MNIASFSFDVHAMDRELASVGADLSPRLNVWFGPPGRGKKKVFLHLARALFGAAPASESSRDGDRLRVEFSARAAESRDGIRDDEPAALALTHVAPGELAELAARYAIDFSNPFVASSWTGRLPVDHSHSWLWAKETAANVLSPADATSCERPAAWLQAGAWRSDSMTTPAVEPRVQPESRFRNERHREFQGELERRERWFRRRDELTDLIARRTGDMRGATHHANAELAAIRERLQARRLELDRLLAELRRTETQLAELEWERRLRTRSAAPIPHVESPSTRLESLRRLEGHCRAALDDCDRRKQEIDRAVLGLGSERNMSPAESFDRQRNRLAGMELLLDEAEKEIGRLLTPSEDDPARWAEDSSARLATLIRSQRAQHFALCGLLGERHRAHRREQLVAESRQLAKLRTALLDQLDELGRQLAAIESSADRDRSPHDVDLVAHDSRFCACPGHAATAPFADTPISANGTELANDIDSLRRHRDSLRESFAAKDREWGTLLADRERLECELNRAATDPQVLEWQRELLAIHERLAASLEFDAAEAPGSLANTSSNETVRMDTCDVHYRKSDAQAGPIGFLHRLTDGEFVRVERAPDERGLIAVRNNGERTNVESLSPAERDLVRLSLSLAAAAEDHRRGVELPLLVGDIFVRLNGSQRFAVVRTLYDYAAAGRQVLLFTADTHAVRQFQTLRADVRELPAPPSVRPAPIPVRRPLSTRPERPTPVAARPTQPTRVTRRERVALGPDSPLEHFGIRDPQIIDAWRRARMTRVADLIDIEPEELVARLARSSTETARLSIDIDRVRQWQACALLRCFLPELTAGDAALLAACGVAHPGDLAICDEHRLAADVARILGASQRRAATHRSHVDRDRVQRWILAARNSVRAWRSSVYARRFDNRIAQRTDVPKARGAVDAAGRAELSSSPANSAAAKSASAAGAPSRRRSTSTSTRPSVVQPETNSESFAATSITESRPARSPSESRARRGRRSRSTRGDRASRVVSASAERVADGSAGTDERESHKFHLNDHSPIVDAPSIGPRMASRLKKIGIETVHELLRRDAAQVAEELDHDRTTEEIVRQWQRQSELMCSIPNLRGHDAQILVASDLIDVPSIIAHSPESLFAVIEPVLKTKEGSRILRGGKRPDLAEVADWIDWARSDRRPHAA